MMYSTNWPKWLHFWIVGCVARLRRDSAFLQILCPLNFCGQLCSCLWSAQSKICPWHVNTVMAGWADYVPWDDFDHGFVAWEMAMLLHEKCSLFWCRFLQASFFVCVFASNKMTLLFFLHQTFVVRYSFVRRHRMNSILRATKKTCFWHAIQTCPVNNR